MTFTTWHKSHEAVIHEAMETGAEVEIQWSESAKGTFRNIDALTLVVTGEAENRADIDGAQPEVEQ